MNGFAGSLLMLGGVLVILSAPDLSGSTIGGAALFLVGLLIAQRRPRPRVRHRDSTAAAVYIAATELAEGTDR